MRSKVSSAERAGRTERLRARSRFLALFAPFRSDLPAWAARLTPVSTRTASRPLWQMEAGSGEAATVWLHGIGGTHRYWTCVPSSLSEQDGRTLLVDLLGFGDSPRPWIRYTTDVHLSALHDCIEHERGALTLIGHSLGAVLALAYAARYPQRIRALVLISLPSFGGLPGAAKWFAAQPGGWLYTNLWAMALACVITRRVAGWVLPWLLRGIPRELAEDMVKHNMASWVTTLWEVLYRQDVPALAETLDRRIPVLLLHGNADRSAPVDGVRKLIERRPQWKLLVLDGVDHHPWLKQPETCMRTIRDWLAEQA